VLELKDLKEMHDKSYVFSDETRENGANDSLFFWITHWDDFMLQTSPLAYRGQFDIIRKAYRQIVSDIKSNPVQNDFVPLGDEREGSGELLDGIYRASLNHNTSIEAFNNADQETIVCGYGAWVLSSEYVTNRGGDREQIIRRRPIMEANNTVFFDPNAKLLDKADADYVSVLTAYSEDGYKKFHEEMTGEELEGSWLSSFKHPQQSYAFPWILGESHQIWIADFYKRELVKDKVLTMTTPFGDTKLVRESGLADIEDELLEQGYEIEDDKTKDIKRWEVTKYIASGKDILKSEVIAGEHIPVVPEFGEHAYVQGQEHWEGMTRLAKDPQRLRNFQLSYLADIVSKSPRQKPIFTQAQIATFEHMYNETGIENDFPYLLMNTHDADGHAVELGPIAVMPEQKAPDALLQSISLSKEAVEDVANPGLPKDISDPDVSGVALKRLEARLDKQSSVYQDHRRHVIRRDTQIYASMAAEVIDSPRKVRIELQDGTRKEMEVMQSVFDDESGEMKVINDLRDMEFEVYSDIGPSYSNMQEQTVEELNKMLVNLMPDDPKREMILLKILELMPGGAFDDIRDYSRKQLILLGIKEPETDEEKQMLQQAQQQQQEPTAADKLAEGELLKGKADILEQQRKGIEMQMRNQIEEMKVKIDAFEAETDRMEVQVDAQEAGADINMTNIKAFGEQLENQAKIITLTIPEMDMNDDQLVDMLMAG